MKRMAVRCYRLLLAKDGFMRKDKVDIGKQPRVFKIPVFRKPLCINEELSPEDVIYREFWLIRIDKTPCTATYVYREERTI